MASELKTIEVELGSEIDRLLDQAMEGPLLLVRGNQRFWLRLEVDEVDEEDTSASDHVERALQGCPPRLSREWPRR